MSTDRSHFTRDLTGLRIAQLIASDGPGGAERVVVHLSRALQARGAETVVFLPRHGEGWLERELAGSGAAIEYFTIDRPLSPRSAAALGQTFTRHRIDVAHGHEFSMAVYGAWASRRAGIPHVMTMHGGRYHAQRMRRRLALHAAVASSASAVAVSSSFARTLSRDLGIRRARIRTIANGVEHVQAEHSTVRAELQLTADDRLIVAVGNLYPVKGHRYLIEALGLLADRHPRLHVAISGRGELHDALAAQAEVLGIADRVHLLGLRSDVASVLRAADLVALPSLSEGLPLALLEAMFAGRAIVASDVGDVRVALADGTAGIVIPPGDVTALAAALDRLLGDPEYAQRLGAAAAQQAQQEYDVSRMVDRYVDLYISALAARPPRPSSVAAPPVRRSSSDGGRPIWVTWETHRRTSELSRDLGTQLVEITSGLPRLGRYTVLLVRTVASLIRHTPDVLIVQCPSIVLGLLAVGLKPLFGYTLVADLHNEAVKPYIVSSRLYERLLRVIHRAADLCIVTNPYLTPVIAASGGRTFVLPDKLPDLPPASTTTHSPSRVVFVCTYSRDEPYLEVIEAARTLDPSVTVFITGRYRGKQPLAVPDNVRLTGFLPEAEYVDLLSSADVVVDLTAIEDCLVCGAYEAVALGRPLVTSDTTALREYFSRGTVYARHDSASLAEAITTALAHRERLASEMQLLKPDLAAAWTQQRDALHHLLRRFRGRHEERRTKNQERRTKGEHSAKSA
jgi:glycosyltransferase involved in cell wall biosynthesis